MQQGQIDDLGFCPSFNCYTSDTLASIAATRISSQLQQQHADEDEFQFSFVTGDTNSDSQTSFPLFNSDLLIQNEPVPENEIASAAGESASSSSEDSDGESPGVFCVWRHKIDAGAVSSPLSKCKKSSSTGSGSKRWRIRDLLRRSNSEGKEPMVLLTHKKVETHKQNGSSADVSTVAGKLKLTSPSVHELLYVQQRAKREGGKRKSYLPYRQGLVGFFSNVNGSGKKLPF